MKGNNGDNQLRIALIDSDIIAYKAAYLTQDGEEQDAIEACDRIHDMWTDKANCDICVPCISSGERFRAKAWPEYKAHRTQEPPKHLAAIKKHLREMENVVWQDGLEADDILGILHTRNPKYETVIVTIDKDLKQIPGRHYNPDRDTHFTVSEEEGERYRWLQVLTGDPGDNYPGIPGIGPKKAEKMLADGCDDLIGFWVLGEYENRGLTRSHFNAMVTCATILQTKHSRRAFYRIRPGTLRALYKALGRNT